VTHAVAVVWFRSWVDFRARWRSWLGLSLLVAVSTGVVLFTVAGARRTDTAWDRLAAKTNAHDALVIGQQFDFDLAAVARLPEVSDSAPGAYVAAATNLSAPMEMTPLVSVDGGFFGRIDRPKIIDGRRPDPDRPEEVGITPPVAAKHNLRVGSTIVLRGLTPSQFVQALSGGEPSSPEGPHVELRVVGIEVSANEGELVESTRSGDNLHLTPAFYRAYEGRIGMGPALVVQLKRGIADQSSFELGVERIAAGRSVQLTTQSDEGSQVRHAIHTQALALELFAAFAALAGAVAVGQALSRQAFVEARDQRLLRALGMTTQQLWSAAMLRTLVVGVLGAVGGAVLAVVASAYMPLGGLARLAEPSPGISIDAPVLGLGLVVVPVLTLALAALPAWRTARTSRLAEPIEAVTTRTVPLAERLARLGFPPTAVTGVRLAVDPGRGRTAAPTRSAIVSTAFSVAALITALTFGASLGHLFSTPRLYGWNWDVVVGNPFSADLSQRVVPTLRDSGFVDGFSGVTAAVIDVGGVRTQGYGFDTFEGDVLPPITNGRPPSSPDELVLGATDLRDLGRHVGDDVTVRVGDREATLRIVGEGVFAQLSIFQIEALGKGALLTGDGLRALVPEAQQNVYTVQWAAAADPQAAQSALRESFGETITISEAEAPLEIADFGRVDGMPAILSGLVALLAIASLAHALMTTVRRRRRDLAILKTLGFVRRQVSSTVAWQATTMTVLALTAGLPLGTAVGHWAWRLFADNLGVVAEPVVPLVALALVVPGAIAIANLVATLPGRAAARTAPGRGLRWE
jgi:ABC-type lipoprotein release transport system permease subunit